MGRIADDFMFALLILKSCHAANSSLPFLHAHALELSAKSAIFHIEGSLATEALGHDIRKLYKKISLTVSGFEALCPREESYTNYRTVWIHDDPGQNVELPHPDTLNEWRVGTLLFYREHNRFEVWLHEENGASFNTGSPIQRSKFQVLSIVRSL